MFFNRSIPLKTLATLSRSLATMLHSGVAVHKAFDMATRKTGDATCRRVLEQVTREILQGADVSTALRCEPGYFPELFLDMVEVAEHSGAVPEVLKALGEHYDNMVRLRRSFIGQITPSILQLLAAIGIVTLLILILGMIAENRGGNADMLGWGLTGSAGAVQFLVVSLGSLASIFGLYYVISYGFKKQRLLDGVLLRIPVLGNCLQSFAIARFSWAYALTAQTGMPIARSLGASFRATGNGAFQGASDTVCALVKEGEELSVALRAGGVFPEDYLQIVEVAESSGTVPESLARLSPEFEDQARRSLKMLAETAGWLVWVIVAGLIIFVIFSIFSRYVGMINNAGGF